VIGQLPELTAEMVTTENPVTRAASYAGKLGPNASLATAAAVGYILRGVLGAALAVGVVYWQQRQKQEAMEKSA
jgi:hypothetical protein